MSDINTNENNATFLSMQKWIGLFLKKSKLLRWWDCPFLRNCFRALTLSPSLNLPSGKLEQPQKKETSLNESIRSKKILSSEIAFHLNKSTIRPKMKCCCHVWAGAGSYYVDIC